VLLRVLTYHRIAPLDREVGLDPRLISASPESFESQMQLVAERFQAVRLADVVAAVRGNRPLPPRAVLITFDDAYRDLPEHAWPILQRFDLPATIFVPTAYATEPDAAFWWDRLHRRINGTPLHELTTAEWGRLSLGDVTERAATMRRLRAALKQHADPDAAVDELCAQLEAGADEDRQGSCLDWDGLRSLVTLGAELAGHTRHHRVLVGPPSDEIRAEIRGCLEELTRETGQPAPALCYPDGQHDQSVRDVARDEGIVVAFGTEDGINDLRRVDPLSLHRTNITPRTTARLLRWRLSTWAGPIDRWRHRRPAAKR